MKIIILLFNVDYTHICDIPAGVIKHRHRSLITDYPQKWQLENNIVINFVNLISHNEL